MAKWEKPPRHDHELLAEWLEENVNGYSAAYDKDRKLQHLEVADMSDEEMHSLVRTLQSKFPQAFA